MKFHVIKILVTGYISLIIIGALILSTPIMHYGEMRFIDALFTSVSALTCVGLLVKDTALDFTFLGQVVILIFIQIGGFGYMSLLGIVYVLIGKKLNKTEKDLIKENINYDSLDGIDKIIKKAFIFVISVEAIGAILLSIHFSLKFGDIKSGIWAGVFHAISAFNNSGFTIFSTNFYDYRDDVPLNLILCTLIVIGGLGHVCCLELSGLFKNRMKIWLLKSNITKMRLSLHTKIVVMATGILIVAGMALILIFEWNNKAILASMPYWERILSSFFTSVNFRTAGFATFDFKDLNEVTLFFSCFFNNIGGSPGGTASGIKTTTIVVLIALSYSIIKRRKDTIIFDRKIPDALVSRAFGIFIIALTYIFVSIFLLSIFEPDIKFMPLLFEASSAFSSAGVSVGNGGVLSLSANFNTIGLIIIMILMISGKIGILSFTLIFAGNIKVSHAQHIQEKIIV